MKPRPVENGYLTKAIEFEQRLDRLEKAKCDCGKEPCKCKNCPKCGSKMNKMGGCMKADCGTKMAKAAIENPKPLPKEKITDVNPHMVTESGGQTKTSYYTTNGHNIESEDVPAKKIPKENSKIEQLGSRLNPHEGTGAEREDTAGEKKNLKKSSKAEMRERNVPMLCGTCGGSKDSGCKGPMPGTDILACPAFKPL
jgi:hypothetical protein